MSPSTIFYSWQSDSPNRTNRGLIQEALERAARSIRLDSSLEVEPVIDRDTLGEPGSPDIAGAIFNKIDRASAFVADVSLACRAAGSRPTPNPNVLLELGYALKSLTFQRVVMVFNLALGEIAELPFDLRSRRILCYRMAPDEEPAPARKQVEAALRGALADIFQKAGSTDEFARDSAFATELIGKLVRIRVFGAEASRRELNPWILEVAEEFRTLSRWLLNANSSRLAGELDLSDDMENLAALLASAVRHEHTFDGQDHTAKVSQVADAATALQDKLLQHGPLDQESERNARFILMELASRLHLWAKRLRKMAGAEPEVCQDMLAALTDIGFQIEQISYYPLVWLRTDTLEDLRKIGQDLHLITHDYELQKYDDEELFEAVEGWDTMLQNLTQPTTTSN